MNSSTKDGKRNTSSQTTTTKKYRFSDEQLFLAFCINTGRRGMYQWIRNYCSTKHVSNNHLTVAKLVYPVVFKEYCAWFDNLTGESKYSPHWSEDR